MAWRPHSRFRVSSRYPQAQGCCDDCGLDYQLVELRFQYQWAGWTLRNTQFRKCRICTDVPQQQLRSIVLPADPLPVRQPRPDLNYFDDNAFEAPVGPPPTPPFEAIPE